MFTTAPSLSPASTAPCLRGQAGLPAPRPCCRCDALAMAETLPATLPRLRALGGLRARDPRTGGQLRDLACDDCRTVWFIAFDRTDSIVEWQVAVARS